MYNYLIFGYFWKIWWHLQQLQHF
ncbi:unnamed protein product, partial [Vitis vinifera]